jgi:septal ring factor EnvC (AmiA/AmiB activator)
MSKLKRTAHARIAAVAVTVAALLACAAALPVSSSASPSLSQLHANLQQAQAQAAGLSASVSHLSGLIGSLGSQISFVQQREAAVRDQLASDRAALARTTVALVRERHQLTILIARLHRAQSILASQLVSNYESGSPDFISVLLTSDGFSQLLNKLNYLRNAEQEQKTEISITRQARNQVHAATVRLAALQATYKEMTVAAAERVRALAGMNALLQSRQAALQQARAAQQAALAAAQARGQALQSQISQVEAQQAAAERAAQAAPALPTPYGTSVAGSWAIPGAVVACESGGQNLTPNSAGASGYYQIIPGTWREFGGSGPAAYLASKQEQSSIAQRIWSSDPAAWDCARMLGIG